MRWLLWREYRLNRLIVITGAVILVLPYLAAAGVLIWAPQPFVADAPNAFVAFGRAAACSFICSQLTLGLLGGNAIAGERADRSAEFVAYLPITRSRRLLAKLLLVFISVAVIWLFNLAAMSIVLSFGPDRFLPHLGDGVVQAAFFAVTGLTFFGVAWFVSSLQSSPTFAVCAGLITPFLLLICLQAIAWVVDVLSFAKIITAGYAITSPLLAIIGFVVGTILFLRRVEP
jgi:ABC-type transport system involved in multi-copper enzyme maturation permease subunit